MPKKYGFDFPTGTTPLEMELYAFRSREGDGRLTHFKRIVGYCWPDRVWHDWTERRIDGLSRCDFVSWAGAASGGKTDDAGLYAMVWWLSDPAHSTVILTSTTGKMIRRRIWPVIQRLYHGFCVDSHKYGTPKYEFPGDLIDSEMTLRARFDDTRRDSKSAIFAKAVKDGNTSKAAADIQGMHNKRVLVIIDEATDTPPAIFDVLTNLIAGTSEFQCLVIGNPSSRLDQHGRFSEPLRGWGSVTIEDEEWETVIQLNGKPGLCQRFDGERCPNVLNPRTETKFLMSVQQLEGYRSKLGERSPDFWKWAKGFWPPAGITNTVMDEMDVIKCGATSRVTFIGRRTPVAGLDPGFGGDDCVLCLGAVGDIAGLGGLVVQVEKVIVLHADAEKPDPVDYQIARETKSECEAFGVRPENFSADATGIGRGVFAILHQEWSGRIHRVEFGGQATEIPASEDDQRPARQVYDRRVTELWFSARTLMRSGRLKGMTQEQVRDFTTREYKTRGGLYYLQTKEEMRETYGRSPDHGDALAVMIDGIRHAGYAGRHAATDRDGGEGWRKLVEQANAVVENVDYATENV